MNASGSIADLQVGGRSLIDLLPIDWRGNPLGPPETWPAELRRVAELVATAAARAMDMERRRTEARLRDATARLAVERTAREAGEAAEAANRAKDYFIAVLSHELRTPLAPVLNLVQLMEMDEHLPSELQAPVAMIRRNVELQARLIDDLLDLTRISRGKLELQLESTDVHERLRQVIATCDCEIRSKRIVLATEWSARHHHVQADPARLQQIMWNLIGNAVKFTPTGGRVTIRTENRRGDSGGERLAVIVRDSGIGIEPERIPLLFNAFEQGERGVTRQFGGLGLGLAISKGLADLHRGSLTGHSDGKGKGATFVLELATLADSRSPHRPVAPETHAPVGPRGARLLLVEDHVDTASTMAQLLEVFGYHVRIASGVEAALRAAEAEKFDLLISDIGLPDGSGLELLRALRVRDPAVKAIALSGYGMEQDRRLSREAGFAEHLTKPINPWRLDEAIRVALDVPGSATAASAAPH